MRRIFAVFFCLLPVLGMRLHAQVPMEEGQVNVLSTDRFLETVHDYRANPDTWVYKGNVPCVIDFYADWCRPCKMLAPVLEEIAREYAGKVLFYKVNVDMEKELAAAFGIASIPSLLFVPMEGKPAMQAGMMSKDQLESAIDSFLLGKENQQEGK